ncbi:MAG: SAP domain-containing protein, partial [Bacteroidales bacterium]|nr:SAP domain-containing protein [Bacteroidales bacterium]
NPMPTSRPPFSEIKTYQEFSKYYWYRDELIQICRELGLPSSGMKIELNRNIQAYFNGETVEEKLKVKTSKSVVTNISLSTKLLECGFTFGPKFREFFAEQTGIKNFKYNTDMVATVKKVKEDNDTTFTLGDLLEIYYGRKTYATYDKSALQWNKFVHDFCADPRTANIPDKLKTAARLWRIVRESTREKIYTPQLLDEYEELL